VIEAAEVGVVVVVTATEDEVGVTEATTEAVLRMVATAAATVGVEEAFLLVSREGTLCLHLSACP
jgi:hypothetical protein